MPKLVGASDDVKYVKNAKQTIYEEGEYMKIKTQGYSLVGTIASNSYSLLTNV